MPGPRIDINEMLAENGRMLKENNQTVNLANIAERFGRTFQPLDSIQVSESFPVISLKSNYGFSTLRDVRETTGSGTVVNTVGDGFYSIDSGTTPGSTARLQSVERGRYVSGSVANPGLGVLVPGVLASDQVARWGYFDDTDGFGFGEDSEGLYVFRREDGVDTLVRRADWDDPLDGTGPSGQAIDQDNIDIYQMPFRWYGSGPIIFKISGRGTRTDTIAVHVFEAPDGQPIVRDPNLPITAEVDNGTTSENVHLEVYGRQFSVLGIYNPNRRITSEYRLTRTVSTTFLPLVSFRQKPEYGSVSVKAAGIDLLVSGNDIVFQLRIGNTLSGATFVPPRNVPETETALEFDITATSILQAGQVIYQGLAAAGSGNVSASSDESLPDVDLPVNEEIVLCARSTGGNADVIAVLRAKEEW